VKRKLIQRFDDYDNDTTKIKKFLDLKQEKTEKMKEYIDRHLELYNRINKNSSRQQSALDSAHFINSLMPLARKEVEKSLKIKYQDKDEDINSIYSESLNKLFNILAKHMGDIQEAIRYDLLAKDKVNHNGEQQKRKYVNESNDSSNKKNKAWSTCPKHEKGIYLKLIFFFSI
jgi:hypothetical protein